MHERILTELYTFYKELLRKSTDECKCFLQAEKSFITLILKKPSNVNALYVNTDHTLSG